MTDARLQTSIEKAFEDRAKITASTKGEARNAVEEALDLLDRGKARVAEKLQELDVALREDDEEVEKASFGGISSHTTQSGYHGTLSGKS